MERQSPKSELAISRGAQMALSIDQIPLKPHPPWYSTRRIGYLDGTLP